VKSLQRIFVEVKNGRQGAFLHHWLITLLILDSLETKQPYATWDWFTNTQLEEIKRAPIHEPKRVVEDVGVAEYAKISKKTQKRRK
jgi:hypothetical protein